MKQHILKNKKIEQIFAICKWLFTILALTFFVVTVWQSRLIISDTLENSRPIYFILAVLVWMVCHLLSPMFVRVILGGFGVMVPYRQILDLHLRYLPARYIPGGIWHTVARVGGLHQLGVKSQYLSSLIIIENLVALGVTLTVGGVLIGFYQSERIWQSIAFVSAVTSLIVLALCPIIINRMILKTKRRFLRRSYISAVIITIIFWSFASTSFLLYVFSVPDSVATTYWSEIVGAYLFSWGIGFIAIFAPQGVGVFEVVASSIIPTNLPFSALIAVVAGFRLVTIMADVFIWAAWSSYSYFYKNYFYSKNPLSCISRIPNVSKTHPVRR